MPGEPIVLVATASSHRQAAFSAAEFLMDYLKTRAPFWKEEARGDATRGSVEGKDQTPTRQTVGVTRLPPFKVWCTFFQKTRDAFAMVFRLHQAVDRGDGPLADFLGIAIGRATNPSFRARTASGGLAAMRAASACASARMSACATTLLTSPMRKASCHRSIAGEKSSAALAGPRIAGRR